MCDAPSVEGKVGEGEMAERNDGARAGSKAKEEAKAGDRERVRDREKGDEPKRQRGPSGLRWVHFCTMRLPRLINTPKPKQTITNG